VGFTHIYTGDGKGKSTASIGILIRALGAGMSVYLGQFFKDECQNDINFLLKVKSVLESNQLLTVKQFDIGKKSLDSLDQSSIVAVIEGFEDLKKALKSGLYDLVIADEINILINLGIISEEEVIKVIEDNKKTEFVLTGRCAKQSVINKANLVSEIVKIKHYCDDGIIPRCGFEF